MVLSREFCIRSYLFLARLRHVYGWKTWRSRMYPHGIAHDSNLG